MTVKPTYEELEKRVRQLEKIKSESKQVEEVLKESETKYRALYENSLEAILLTAQDGSIYAANQVACEILEKSESEIISGGRDRIVNLDDPRLPAALEERYKKGKFNGELTLKKKDGTIFPVELSSSTFQDCIGNEKVCIFFRDISERKRAEEALKSNYALLQIAGETAKFGGWSVDLEKNICTWSDAVADIHDVTHGYSPPVQEAINFYAPEWRKKITQCFNACAKNDISYDEEMEIITQKGKRVWVRTTAKALKNTNGKIIKVQGSFQDITERKQAEEALQESEEKFRLAFHTSPDSINLNRLEDGVYIDINDGFTKLMGHTRQDVVGKSSLALNIWANPEDRQRLVVGLKEHGIVENLEAKFTDKNGQNKTALMSARILRINDEDLILSITRDITERKRAETYREMGREILQILNEPGDLKESIQLALAALKTRTGVDTVGLRLQEGEDFPYYVQDGFSKDFLLTENTLIERGKDGSVCRDKDGNVRLECTCGLVISGKTDPSNPLFTQGGSCWTNDSFPLLDLPADQDPRLHPRNNCIHQGYASVALIPVRIQNQIYSRETCIRHGFSSMAQVPVRTSDRIAGLIQLNDKRKGRFTPETIEILEGIASHVGSALMRKQAEEEKEKLHAQLNQAQKLESVGRLAGGVAHDFNNMLGVILGHTELALLQADENHDLYDDLKEIQTAAKRSADITKQLLTFARKDIISPKKIDLNDTVESMLNMLRRLIGEDIDLIWKPSAHLWPVKMDTSQIDQILVNLCVNARDAISGVGKLTIETGIKTFDEAYCNEHPGFIPGDFVLLAVSDDGCGMDKDTLDNLFEPFFTTKEVGKGTGLGLATIYGIIKQNNGFINVYSEQDQGSTFNIYLSRLVAGEDIDKAVPEKKTAAGGSETILLVEDEPTILRMTRMMLERKGYSVLPAATPGEAIGLAKTHADKIHLLMTDVVMPEMNGRDLAGQITVLYPGICLLFMSGYTEDIIAHQGILDDGVTFIQKPFSMADMTEKVRELLDMASDKSHD
jgi:PAS domain S-box-containing protein